MLSRTGITSHLNKPFVGINGCFLDWMMFAAAVTTNNTARDGVVHLLHNLAASNRSDSPFCVAFEIQTGICAGGSTSPAQGGLFALLAMK